MTKKIAVYQNVEVKVPVRQRYHKWVYHRKGSKAGQKWYKKRVWKTTKRLKKVVKSGRYELYGTGKQIYRATVLAHRLPPKPEKSFVRVSAVKFLENPYKYGQEEAIWVEKPTVESI